MEPLWKFKEIPQTKEARLSRGSYLLWGEAAEGRPSSLKSFQNVYGILRESLGTFGESLGNVWEIPAECLWNLGGISRKSVETVLGKFSSLKRASRSLAKSGFFRPLWIVLFTA